MREILFRGKRIDNDEWVEGYYVRLYGSNGRVSRRIYTSCAEVDCGDYYPDFFEVQPATVGQYTGLKDKNGRRIFEGDICQNDKTGGIVFVAWHGTMAGFVWSKKKWCDNLFDFGELFRVHDKYKVIGNIHDNPELLEVR